MRNLAFALFLFPSILLSSTSSAFLIYTCVANDKHTACQKVKMESPHENNDGFKISCVPSNATAEIERDTSVSPNTFVYLHQAAPSVIFISNDYITRPLEFDGTKLTLKYLAVSPLIENKYKSDVYTCKKNTKEMMFQTR